MSVCGDWLHKVKYTRVFVGTGYTRFKIHVCLWGLAVLSSSDKVPNTICVCGNWLCDKSPQTHMHFEPYMSYCHRQSQSPRTHMHLKPYMSYCLRTVHEKNLIMQYTTRTVSEERWRCDCRLLVFKHYWIHVELPFFLVPKETVVFDCGHRQRDQ